MFPFLQHHQDEDDNSETVKQSDVLNVASVVWESSLTLDEEMLVGTRSVSSGKEKLWITCGIGAKQFEECSSSKPTETTLGATGLVERACRGKQMPLLRVTERQPNGAPVLEEGEDIIHTEENVALWFDAASCEGIGVLFVTSKHIIWLSSAEPAKGFSMDYYFISIHAISNDSSFFPHPCIYCQLESEETPEARFAPQQVERLPVIYNAFCSGAVLNPDAEEEGEGDFVYNEQEVEMGLRGEQLFPLPANGDSMDTVTQGIGSLSTNEQFADDADDEAEGEGDEDDPMN